MKKRWLCLLLENQTGVVARISGLMSSKLYNIDSLTAGVTEDPTISRITLSITSDDKTFEQIKKQLNRCVEVIKVIDYTSTSVHMNEILYAKIKSCNEKDKNEIFRIAEVFKMNIIDYDSNNVLLQCTKTEIRNDEIIEMLKTAFINRVEIVRGGIVAIESISVTH